MPHALLFYTLAPDYLGRRPVHRNAHLALAWAAVERGELVLGGALEPADRAVLLFHDCAMAEAFARADPYVTEGLVTQWEVRQWTTVVGQDAARPMGRP